MPGSEKKRSQNALSPTSRNSISDRPASLKPWTRRWTKIPGKKPNDSERFRVVDRKLPLNGVTVLGPGGRRLPENSGRIISGCRHPEIPRIGRPADQRGGPRAIFHELLERWDRATRREPERI